MTCYFVTVQYETQEGRTALMTSEPMFEFDEAFTLRAEYEATGHAVWIEEEDVA